MTPLLRFGVWSTVLALVLTPICRDIFRSYGVVDQPDKSRKLHRYPIPRVGGIAIFISYFAAYYLSRSADAHVFGGVLALVGRLFPATAVIFAVGLIDDFLGLKPWQKLLGQLVAVGLAIHAGVRIDVIANHPTGQSLGLVLTALWLLATTNAFNLVDGLDGLAAGIGLFATVTIFAAATIQHNLPLQFATLPLAGCMLGFLCYNFSPATIFLGDGGSLLIGFLLGCYGVVWAQKSVTFLGMTAPLMALSIPLLDTTLAIVRRFLRRQPIFTGDRGHIHHKLLDRGLTPLRVVLLLYGICTLAAACSLLQVLISNFYISVLLVVLFGFGAWIGIHYLRYTEFSLVGRLVRNSELQLAVEAHLMLDSFEKALDTVETCDDYWQVLRSFYRRFGFRGVRLSAHGRTYEDWDAQTGPENCWLLNVPLGGSGHIEFAREFGSLTLSFAVVSLIELLRSAFDGKISADWRAATAGHDAT